MRHIGTVSYGMYLMHMLAMNAVAKAVPAHGVLRFVLALGLLATVGYVLIEGYGVVDAESDHARPGRDQGHQ